MSKGIILAGGTGSRLHPLTRTTNKCLLPVGSTPMVCRMLDLFVSSGIDDIMLVTGPEHMGQVISLLGSGSEFGCSMTYKVQDKANGIAAALKLCKDFVSGQKFSVILGDNIFSDHSLLIERLSKFPDTPDDYELFVKKVPDPERFGVPIYQGDRVVDIIEKPKTPPCDQAVVGLYSYTPKVFDIIDGLKPSSRGEYEISEVNSWLVKNSRGTVTEINCDWVDAGTHSSYQIGRAHV